MYFTVGTGVNKRPSIDEVTLAMELQYLPQTIHTPH